MQEGDQEEEPLPLFYQVAETCCLESVVVYHIQDIVDCTPEAILGFARQLPQESGGNSQPTPCSSSTGLRSRPGQTTATVEQPCTEVAAGELLYTYR